MSGPNKHRCHHLAGLELPGKQAGELRCLHCRTRRRQEADSIALELRPLLLVDRPRFWGDEDANPLALQPAKQIPAPCLKSFLAMRSKRSKRQPETDAWQTSDRDGRRRRHRQLTLAGIAENLEAFCDQRILDLLAWLRRHEPPAVFWLLDEHAGDPGTVLCVRGAVAAQGCADRLEQPVTKLLPRECSDLLQRGRRDHRRRRHRALANHPAERQREG